MREYRSRSAGGGIKEKMKCARCGAEVDEEDVYDLKGEKVCEDCYFDEHMPRHPCDPIAQSIADRFSCIFGETKPEELPDIQRKIYEFIKNRGKATHEEILREFDLRHGELTQNMIVLRRLRLVKGAKIGDKIYYVPWEW